MPHDVLMPLAGAVLGSLWWLVWPYAAPIQRIMNIGMANIVAITGIACGVIYGWSWSWQMGLGWFAAAILLQLSNRYLPRPGEAKPWRIVGATALVGTFACALL